ncbi:hypothetical protein E5198_09360 [Pseudomonas sp. A-1]|uniref:hypothetical protein n=1 Tax=Pseudomonas sp. A-1 TaxID=1821274 RepID=UPI0010A6181E|nr:hypothetical protein [Pseudomonas sp. A-1]THG82304.1 hypothetical protein E5198_09360 [Pseudomonas sp. A-1]
MSVKIKKRICPSEWFSLDNYKNVSDFGILEWRNELLLRALILKYLGVSGFSLLSSSVLACGVSISEFEGFLKVSRGLVTGGFFPREISGYAPLGTAKMKDLRFQAYRDKEAFNSGSASHDLVERWKKVLPVVFLEKDFLSTMELDISIEHEEKIFSPHLLKVNLGAPDSVLIKAFSDWISCARASRSGGGDRGC